MCNWRNEAFDWTEFKEIWPELCCSTRIMHESIFLPVVMQGINGNIWVGKPALVKAFFKDTLSQAWRFLKCDQWETPSRAAVPHEDWSRPYWPVGEARLHAVHAGLHGDFSLWFVLPVLLVTQQEEATQLLAPRRQQGCNKDAHKGADTLASISAHMQSNFNT